MSRVTLSRIAAETGVSVSTVSRVLRGAGEIRPETRARILAAARALGHSPGGESRGRPRSRPSQLIDLVLGHFHDPYTDEVTTGARTAAAELGYDLVLTAERDIPDDDWPMRIRARGSAGVVIGLIMPTRTQLAILAEAGMPIVLLDPWSEMGQPLTSVRTTDGAGGAEAAEHLVAQGARRFVVVGGSPSYRYGRARVDGFENAIRRLLPDAEITRVHGDWTAPSARRACLPALDAARGAGPIGLFACSDEMAAGAYRAAADLGLEIPRDLLVVGFDDVRGAKWLQPALTTVRQPIREMASAAVRALLEDQHAGPRVIELPTSLQVRGSTMPPTP